MSKKEKYRPTIPPGITPEQYERILMSDSIHVKDKIGLECQDWPILKFFAKRGVPILNFLSVYKDFKNIKKWTERAIKLKKGVEFIEDLEDSSKEAIDLYKKYPNIFNNINNFLKNSLSGEQFSASTLLSQLGMLRLALPEKELKPLLPKLPVRIRGLDELYKKIEPVKIDYDKYLIKPVEETVSSIIKPIGSGLKGGFLKTMLSFLTDSVNVSLPLGKLGSSDLFKSLRGFAGFGRTNILSTLSGLLGGKNRILGSLFGKGVLFGDLLGKGGLGGIFGGGEFGGIFKGGLGGIPGKGGLPDPGFDKIPACQFSCPLLSGSKGGRFPGLFDEKKDGPLAPWMPSFAQMPGKDGGLEHLKTIREMYDKMFEQIIGGNDKIMASFDLMFRKMLEWATGSFDKIGKRSSILNKDLYGGLSSYAMNLGTVSGYASRAFAAFRTLNPFGAAAASFGLIALGQMLRSLSSGIGGGAGWGGGSATRLATAGAGGSTAESTWRGPQVVNVYIDGIRSANVYEVDRSLDRAGVDRELRNRIRELVRTGSNPIREY